MSQGNPQSEELEEKRESEKSSLDPKFLAFLDAKTLEERFHILQTMQDVITDEMLNSMAVVLDIVVPEGSLPERYAEFKKCMQTIMKYQLRRPY